MVVGQGHGIKMALQNRDHAGVRAKGVHLLARAARRGNHTLQIGDADIGCGKRRREMRIRVAALGNEFTRRIVEHAVTRKDQTHALSWNWSWNCNGYGRQTQATQAEACHHGFHENQFHGSTPPSQQR